MQHKKGELLAKALRVMIDAHESQFDKGGKPYALHPLAVMNILNTDDEELQCIALLHDVVEDSSISFKELLDLGFTTRIVDAVKLLTKQRGQTHEEYLQGLYTSKDAMKVKIADITHNSDIRRLKGLREKDKERMVKYHTMYLDLHMKLGEQ